MSPAGRPLTDLERDERSVSERDLQLQVTSLAEAYGWAWCHWRPLQNRRGFWRTPVEGPLGQGWPDLTLLRIRDRRLIFAELKSELEQPTAIQAAVLAALGELDARQRLAVIAENEISGEGSAWYAIEQAIATIEVHVWRPSDLRDPIEDSVIGRILR